MNITENFKQKWSSGSLLRENKYKWIDKTKDLSPNIQYLISELVEEKSTTEEKYEGWNIADYILKIYLNRKKAL